PHLGVDVEDRDDFGRAVHVMDLQERDLGVRGRGGSRYLHDGRNRERSHARRGGLFADHAADEWNQEARKLDTTHLERSSSMRDAKCSRLERLPRSLGRVIWGTVVQCKEFTRARKAGCEKRHARLQKL